MRKGFMLMFRKSNKDNGEKIFRYSIRKYHFGAASVAVAALMFFANGVQAQAPAVSSVTASDVVAGPSGNSDRDPQGSDEESPEKTAVVEQPVGLKSAGESSAPKAKAEEGSREESEAEVKSSQPETKIDDKGSAPVADTSVAKSIQGNLQALLANLTLDSMKSLHTEVEEGLAKAKVVLENPKATQAQVDEQARLMAELTSRVNQVLNPSLPSSAVLEKAGLTNHGLATPEGAILTPKIAVTKVLEENPVSSANGEVSTPSTELSKPEVSDNQNKDKLKTLSKDLSTYLIQANKITRPETKKLLEGVEEIVKSIEASVLQPQLTPAEIEELLKKGKQAERKLALALTRENSGKRDLLNGKPMKQGSDFRANTTGLSTKRAYIVQKDDGSDLPAETYLYALKRGLNERPQENNLREVREALEEAKVTVQDNGNGDFTWTVRFNSGYKGHQNAFYWFTIPKGHKVTEVLALTRTPSRGGRSSSIGYFDLDREWDAKIKSIVGGDKIGVHGPAKGPHSFNRNFDSLRDVTNTTYVASAGGTQRVQSEDPVSDKNSSGYYYLGPLFNRFHRIDWSTSVPNEVAKKAARNIEGLHANTNHLYHFTLDSGEVKITYKTHTEDKYAPLYYAAGMRSIESSTANMYFMARGLQEKPNAPTVKTNNEGTVTVTPYSNQNQNVDKVELSYMNASGESKTAILTRNPQTGTWLSNDAGIEVSQNSFIVKKGAVKAGTQVTAKSYFGNSDPSDIAISAKLVSSTTPTFTVGQQNPETGAVTVTVGGVGNGSRVTLPGVTGEKTVANGKVELTNDDLPTTANTGKGSAQETGKLPTASASNITIPAKLVSSTTPTSTPRPDSGANTDNSANTNNGGTSTPADSNSNSGNTPAHSGDSTNQAAGQSTQQREAGNATAPESSQGLSESSVTPPARSRRSVGFAGSTQSSQEKQVDKSVLRDLIQDLETRLKDLDGIDQSVIDAAKVILGEGQEALRNTDLTEAGLREITAKVKEALESLKGKQATKDKEEMQETSKDQGHLPYGTMIGSLLALLGLLLFLIARRKKESELKKLTKELTKVLQESDLTSVDAKVLDQAREALAQAVAFLANEKESDHTEDELIEKLKAILAQLK